MMLKKFQLLYYITFTAFIISGLSFLSLVVLSFSVLDIEGTLQVIAYSIAAVFWLCLLIGTISLIFTNITRKKLEKENNLSTAKLSASFCIGIFSFFKNKKSIVADIILFVSLITNVIIIFMNISINWLIISGIFIFVFSLIFHSFWDGKNYKYLTYFKNNINDKGCSENE